MSREYAEKNWNFMLRGENTERLIFFIVVDQKVFKAFDSLNSKIDMIIIIFQMAHQYANDPQLWAK